MHRPWISFIKYVKSLRQSQQVTESQRWQSCSLAAVNHKRWMFYSWMKVTMTTNKHLWRVSNYPTAGQSCSGMSGQSQNTHTHTEQESYVNNNSTFCEVWSVRTTLLPDGPIFCIMSPSLCLFDRCAWEWSMFSKWNAFDRQTDTRTQRLGSNSC